MKEAFHPSTTSAHLSHFRTFLLFLFHFKLPLVIDLRYVLAFLQFLTNNHIQPKVIGNYVSSIRTMASWFNLEHSALSHQHIFLFLRSIRINNPTPPTEKGVFDIPTIGKISELCEECFDSPLFRAIFLTAFFGFLRMSNIAPHSKAAFDCTRHLLRKDIVFKQPGLHIKIKWSKTNQNRKNLHFIQLPKLSNPLLCPVRAVYELLSTRKCSPDSPLFVLRSTGAIIIDTQIRDMLKSILVSLGIPLQGNGFHTFRLSGAVWTFDNQVSIEQIMYHGAWRSNAVWEYLQHASLASATVPLTFASLLP